MRFTTLITVIFGVCATAHAQQNTPALQSTEPMSGQVTVLLPSTSVTSLATESFLDTLATRGFQQRGLAKTSINLGNVGATTYDLVFDYQSMVSNQYTKLAAQAAPKMYYFSTNKPITYAEYQTGTAQEQLFKVLHTQNIKNNNLIVGLDKVNSKGMYLHQAVNNTHFYAQFLGGLFGKKYQYALYFDRSKIANQLNGGLVNDSTFTNNSLSFGDKGLLPVNLAYAKQTLVQQVAYFKQSYSFKGSTDSLPNLTLFNELKYTGQKRIFYDSVLNPAFYDYNNYNSNTSKDTVNYHQLEATFGSNYSFKIKDKWHFQVQSKVETAYNLFRQLYTDTSVLDIRSVNELTLNNRVLAFNLKFDYLLNDRYTNNDFNTATRIRYRINASNAIFGSAVYRKDRPQLDLLRYDANGISWANSYLKTDIFSMNATYELNIKNNIIRLFSTYTDIVNPIFFNLFKQPQQIVGVSQVIQTGIQFETTLKKWHFENQTIYQYTGGYQVLKMPKLYSNLLAEYTFGIFKNKMDLTIGTTITYYSKFNAPKFDPITNQFYITTAYEVGNYPFVDVFLKAKVQRFKILLASSHVNQGLMGATYFYLPNYPANDRMFKIALSWLFLN